MKKALYIIGPSSTGKTTLCDALAQKLGLQSPAYVREVARRVMRDKGYSRDTISSLQMQIDIMDGHLEDEDTGLRASDLVLCDRSAIDPVVYAILTSRSEVEAKEREEELVGRVGFQRALARYRGAEDGDSIFILLAPVRCWVVDDGVRSLEDQGRSFCIFQRVLGDLGLPYRTLGEECQSLQDRTNFVLGLLG